MSFNKWLICILYFDWLRFSLSDLRLDFSGHWIGVVRTLMTPVKMKNRIHEPDWVGAVRTRAFPFPSDSAYDPSLKALENSRYFATLPVLSREMIAEIPYRWRVSTQICEELLIGWRKFPTNQKLYPDLACKRHHYGISALVSQTLFRGETTAKYLLFSQRKPLRLSESH